MFSDQSIKKSMAFRSKIFLTVFLIVVFDAIGSVLSRLFQLDYGDFVWGSFLLYVTVGFWGAYRRGLIYGVILGALAGLTDSTIGWFVSAKIEPFTKWDKPQVTTLEILIVILFVTVSGIVLGSIGAAACRIFGQTQPNPTAKTDDRELYSE